MHYSTRWFLTRQVVPTENDELTETLTKSEEALRSYDLLNYWICFIMRRISGSRRRLGPCEPAIADLA